MVNIRSVSRPREGQGRNELGETKCQSSRYVVFLGLAGYYRRFENGLKLSIRGKIVGLRSLRDRDSMVGTTLTIEREIEDAQSTRDVGVGSKREDRPSSSSGKRQKTSTSHEFQDQGKDSACEMGLPLEIGIPGLWGQHNPS